MILLGDEDLTESRILDRFDNLRISISCGFQYKVDAYLFILILLKAQFKE